jgi:hypothetical protein
MSTSEEFTALPPSVEVQREMARAQIADFKSINDDYRKLAEITFRHASGKRMNNLRLVSRAATDSSDPLAEALFFKDLDPALVQESVAAVLEDINQNRRLASTIDEDFDPEEDYDDEFQQKLVDQLLSEEPEPEDEESRGLIVISDPFDMAPSMLAKFMGGLHSMSVDEIFRSLEESEGVAIQLDREYERQQHMHTAFIGLVAFAGAFGGSLLAGKINGRK